MTAENDALEWKKNALRVIEALELRIDSLERAKVEPIAVIGLACHVPGAPDSDAFWRLLDQGVNAIGEIPADRFDVDDYYDPDPDAPGKTITRRGGFLSQIDRFDAELFGISPREAVSMDPQHRLLLEVSWEALEQAALSADRLRGSRTGVFMGICSSDYALLLGVRGVSGIDAYMASGVSYSAGVGRISYLLGLEGPNLAIDTACSSSLVAVHQARRSLLAGECDLALAGGVNSILTPAAMISFSRARMLAADGHCKTFDAAADGFSRGEGCGVVVLKRLSDAKRDGDRIMAVIRGSAVNQDGASSGLTVPNGPAQTRVIRDALAQAGIAPRDVDYLEAHGTGTSLGDPIEVEAAAAALGEGRDPRHPLLIGSVKTNIGHLEAAAGIAGLIKVVLSLQHERIPPHLHFRKPNPHIPWADLPVRVTQNATAWPKPQRIAGVSAFGFSGTNAHVVLQSAPDQEDAPPENETTTPAQHLLPLSAKNEAALKALAARYASWWTEHPQAQLGDVAFTLATGRSHLKQRAAVVAGSVEEARTRLAALQSGDTCPGLFTGHVRGRAKLAWLFTGQGSQYVGMGRDLYAQQPVFRRVIDDCAERLGDALAAPLQEILFEKAERLGDTRNAQPAIFALELGLARLWQSWGIEPDVVLGHSLGEYVAACVAGVFGWEAGLHLVAQRALWMSQVKDAGAMAAVFADAEQVTDAIQGHPELSVAAYNGAHVVVSGAQEAVEQLLAALRKRNIRCERLNTSHAFHSSLIEPALEPLEALAGTMAFHPARRTLISNLTGRPLAGGQVLDAAYWRRQAREPVQFARSLQSLADQGVETLLEIGPHPVLLGMAATAWPQDGSPPAMAATLRRGSNDNAQLAETLGQLYVRGVTADFAAVHAQRPGRKLSLPTYPFQRQRYWVESSPRSRYSRKLAHPLLGDKHDLAPCKVTYTRDINLKEQPWLLDHQVFDAIAVPAAYFVSQALCLHTIPCSLANVSFQKALLLDGQDRDGLQVQLILNESSPEKAKTFQVFSRGSRDWTLHAEGTLVGNESGMTAANGIESLQSLRDRLEERSVPTFYEREEEAGIRFGPSFRGLASLWVGDDEALGEIVTPADLSEEGWPMHPAVLDACFQVAGTVVPVPAGISDAETYLPFEIGAFDVTRTMKATRLYCHARRRDSSRGGSHVVDLCMFDEHGQRWGWIENLVLVRAERGSLLRGHDRDPAEWLYDVQWQEQPNGQALSTNFLTDPATIADSVRPSYPRLLEDAGFAEDDRHLLAQEAVIVARGPREADIRSTAQPGSWLILTDRQGVGARLAERLHAANQRCLLVEHGDKTGSLGEGRYQVSANDAPSWEFLLKEAPPDEPPFRGVVHLWSIDAAMSGSSTAESLARDTRLGCGSILLLMQALMQSELTPSSGLWLVTRGGQFITGDLDSSVGQSPLWGMGTVLALEHPELACRRVDLDLQNTDVSLQQLVTDLLNADNEDQIAFRGQRRLVPRLRRHVTGSSEPPTPLTLKTDGTYLITGGLSGLGLEVARWMVKRGARRLVLNGRRPPVEAAEIVLAQLREAGAEVRVALGDIAKPSDVQAIFREIDSDLPPLRGVLHCAAVFNNGMLTNENWRRFEEVLGPKVLGSWNLHQLTADRPLDFFVMFSSMAALLGAPGQANYAAANTFLDVLTHYRRSLGLTATSINWAAWSHIGAAVRNNISSQFERAGVGWIHPEQGLSLLERLMFGESVNVAVAPIEWPIVRRRLGPEMVPPLLTDMLPSVTERKSESAPGQFWQRLQQVSAKERRPVLIRHLQKQVSQVLQLDSLPDPDVGFFSLGMDSLMAVELRNRLQRQLGSQHKLSSTLLFDHSSIIELADYLAIRLNARSLGLVATGAWRATSSAMHAPALPSSG